MTTPHMLVTNLRLKCLAALVLAVAGGGCGQSAVRGREYTQDMTYSVS